MLIRQKTILYLLLRAQKALSPTVFVKLAFLLRQETCLKNESTFYDFVPYKFGPFSFSLYRELTNLRRDGYVASNEETVALCEQTTDLIKKKIFELPAAYHEAVDKIVRLYGRKSQDVLLKDVYSRYPWYGTKSELTSLRGKISNPEMNGGAVVYTAGYEGKSVDTFFNNLLEHGIRVIIDVRSNPLSRRYGFSKKQLNEISIRLGMDYRHMPELGIPGKYRNDLTDFDSYQRLLKKYEQEMIPNFGKEIAEVGKLMGGTPSALVCMEKDVRCCHRSRLAEAVSRKTGLEVAHL